MKTNTITERNRIVETHLWCIDAVMQGLCRRWTAMTL